MRYSIHITIALTVTILVAGCSSFLSGPERLARVEQLVAEQEYGKAEALLANIDARDAEFEALLVRRRAIRPLIVQFEENTLRQVEVLKKADEWPAAESLLQDAIGKLPQSVALRMAESQFYADRMDRLRQLDREMSLLLGEHLSAKTPLVIQAEQIHPKGFKTRWQTFWHGRESESLARDLLMCGEHALEESRFDLAESCLKMAADLTKDEAVTVQLAILDQRRRQEEVQAAARAQAQREAEQAARRARRVEQVSELKSRYRYLAEAGWLSAAREILSELRSQAPSDPEVAQWSMELQTMISGRVSSQIKEGQALYSAGRLHEALAVWRDAEKLAPNDAVLQAHIARVERFIAKLERLDNEEV